MRQVQHFRAAFEVSNKSFPFAVVVEVGGDIFDMCLEAKVSHALTMVLGDGLFVLLPRAITCQQ